MKHKSYNTPWLLVGMAAILLLAACQPIRPVTPATDPTSEPAASPAYDLRWFPNAVYLAANAAQAAGQPRLLIEPAWSADRDLRTQLAQRGLKLEPQARFGQFTVYRLVEQRSIPCRWCYCGPRFTLTPLTTATDPVMMTTR